MKVLLDLSSYPTKKELKNATGADTSNLVTEIDFIVLNAEVDKLDHRTKNYCKWFEQRIQ